MRQKQRWTGRRENRVASTRPKRMPCSCLSGGKKPMESVRVADYEVQFDQHATRWLGNWIDSKTTLKEHHSARMKKAREAVHCIRRQMGQLGMCPDACRRALVACVQASALWGRAVVGRREGSGVKNPARRAPEAAEPAREGHNGELWDH